jgi:hypothetical protein
MTNKEAARHLRLVADFLDSDLAVDTKCWAMVKLTTPVPPGPEDKKYQFATFRNNTSELRIHT